MPVDLTPSLPKPAKSFELKGGHVLAALIVFFAVIFAVNATMMSLAIRTMPGIEVKSAYEASQQFNRRLDAIAEQDQRGWQVDVGTGGMRSGTPFSVHVRDKAGTELAGLTVGARFERPADARFDHKVVLADLGAGRYSAATPALAPGQWVVTIEILRGSERQFVSQRRIVVKE